jgi:glycine cleavage system T protein (aminomethyltransferase)
MALADFERIDDFGDAAAEARACRSDCALFDFSFLECVRLEGVGARGVVESFTGRSLAALDVGRICYALRVGSGGDVVADLTVWRLGTDCYEVMSGRREDVEDLLGHADPGVRVADMTPKAATFALQGPGALDALRPLGDSSAIESLEYFNFGQAKLNGITCRIGRLGYTGEAGFEIILPRASAQHLWQVLSAQARPAGFIAADMLRIEAGFVLFSNEFRLPVSPAEAGLEKFHGSVDLPSPRVALISFHADADALRPPWQPSRDLARPGAPGEIVVTSACESLAAGGILGLGYVRADDEIGARLHDPAGVFRNIRRAPMPFYDSAKRRPRQPWR